MIVTFIFSPPTDIQRVDTRIDVFLLFNSRPPTVIPEKRVVAHQKLKAIAQFHYNSITLLYTS